MEAAGTAPASRENQDSVSTCVERCFFLWIKWHISQAILSASFLYFFCREKDNLQKKASLTDPFYRVRGRLCKWVAAFLCSQNICCFGSYFLSGFYKTLTNLAGHTIPLSLCRTLFRPHFFNFPLYLPFYLSFFYLSPFVKELFTLYKGKFNFC